MSISFKDVLLIEAFVSPSSNLSKYDNKSQSLLVIDLIKVLTCPTYLLCSRSEPPVFVKKASLKQ